MAVKRPTFLTRILRRVFPFTYEATQGFNGDWIWIPLAVTLGLVIVLVAGVILGLTGR